ncbi:23S rRNA (uracil(1939)-C(5))-methyltransferase RlmD, partial [bacterium]|nr:23S rRNA (uracil(1939)-C(5))-methyltransferase RlmD [bacterium]
MNLGDIVELKIEKLLYQGVGLARYSNSRFSIFVENVLPDEIIKAKIISLNKTYARASLIEIINPSPYRIKPFCSLYNACGSCQIQICDYDYLIKLKTDILAEIFPDIKINTVLKSPKTLEYRRKTQYPAQQTKNSKRILLGYYKNKSHDLTNIKFCPVQPDIINKIAQFIREYFPLDCYMENTKKGLLKHVVTRIAQKGEILLTLVLNDNKIHPQLFDFARKITLEFPEIKGVIANFNQLSTNKILSNKTKKITGNDYIIEYLDDKTFKIGALSFFQVNVDAAKVLFNLVKENIKPNSTILDAYAGVGAIGIFVSDCAKNITYIEENKEAASLARENYKLNNIKNYEIFEGDAKKHFLNFKKQNKTFDYVILDPPRSGCDKEGLLAVSELALNIIYVSCNPQTLKRDSEILKQKGFKIKFLQ